MSFFYLFDKSLFEYMYIELIWGFFSKRRDHTDISDVLRAVQSLFS